MPHTGPLCAPPVFNPGKNLQAHDHTSDCYYWSVVVGRVPGIYLDLDQALGQTYKFPGQKFKRCDVYQDAVAYWNNSCRELHDHSPRQYFKVKGLTKAFPTYDEALAAAAAEYIISVKRHCPSMSGDPSFEIPERDDLAGEELRAHGSIHGSLLALLVPEEIWRILENEHLDIWTFSGPVLYIMQRITTGSKQVFQPYLYRHIHLRSASHALLFFRTFASRCDLYVHVLSLHFGFIPVGPVWNQIQQNLPNFAQLSFLSFAHSPQDPEPLDSILNNLTREHLPPSLRTLHLRLTCNPADKNSSIAQPWNSPSWPLHLARIPSPITTFILTTPHPITQPPTAHNLESTLKKWTAELSTPSRIPSELRLMIINQGMDATEISLGTRILWESPEGRSWSPLLFPRLNFEGEKQQLAALFGHKDDGCWAHVKPYSSPSVATSQHVDRGDW
ncbi:hypothetical protein B0H11DRAFT_1921241 [Mycena galericulata]|nr:hypothetical protein B0H11DRAFT_1921241 [Mycena galericulata]